MIFLTFNIRHAQGQDEQVDIDRIFTTIVNTHADVIALQEVDRFMARSGYIDQAAVLASALHMDWRFAASIRHGHCQYGNAILSKYPIVNEEIKFLPGEKERRSMLETIIDTGKKRLTVLTTHLGVTERDRVRQLPLLKLQLMKVDFPAILIGDFNMEANHPLMIEICELGWRRIAIDEDLGGTVMGGATIDHILWFGDKVDWHAHSVATSASDHRPVWVEIDLDMV